jgi:hypothetical protein
MEEIKDNEISELDKEIIYLDEELPEIEYYELLSFDEIIENNPNFIALTRREIYNELYELFKNSNKSNNYLELFYDITKKKLILLIIYYYLMQQKYNIAILDIMMIMMILLF